MKNIKLLVALCGTALLGSINVSQAAVQQGLWELGFSGSYSALDVGGVDLDLLLLDVRAGYFVTNGLEVSAAATYLDADLAGEHLDAKMFGAGVDYHFATDSAFVPYVGGGFHWVDVGVGGLGSDDDWAWEARAGLKHFVADNVAFKYQLSYIDFDEIELDGWTVSAGIAFFF